ncbi:uncharacterized protein LOC124269963 [Haliotis rubra]|uniref:uncharacterized protein LOC124269963 n=1 Tax=Haliotis rubra TaxID=36100 RepID=UPI001EE58852|nr:uncharacterized protein LOC124269963 [Haliotis rubra]
MRSCLALCPAINIIYETFSDPLTPQTVGYIDLCWLRATQFFETVGLIAIGIAAVILFLSLVVQSLRNKKLVTILNALTCFVAFGTIIVGAIIYASRSNNSSYLSWAFALCIVGAILEGVAGTLILVGSFATRS